MTHSFIYFSFADPALLVGKFTTSREKPSSIHYLPLPLGMAWGLLIISIPRCYAPAIVPLSIMIELDKCYVLWYIVSEIEN
jgi:hypothetical protein